MASLLEREGMAGQVQTVYFDPPYGIKYGGNWQIKLNNRDVKDGNDEALTGEPEQIKAFRDTWELGIHSYLGYLRDRLLIAKELLNDSGSCFLQIGDENIHLVRSLMDEVFGQENFLNEIIWHYENKFKFEFTTSFNRDTETIFLYSKNPEHIFKHIKIPVKNKRMQNEVTWDKEKGKMVTKKDADGKVSSPL